MGMIINFSPTLKTLCSVASAPHALSYSLAAGCVCFCTSRLMVHLVFPDGFCSVTTYLSFFVASRWMESQKCCQFAHPERGEAEG